MLLTDVLCYDSLTGRVAFFASDGSYTLQQPAALSATWETNLIIVPGKFKKLVPGSTGGVYSDLFIYNPTSREGQFYTTDGNGNRSPFGLPIPASLNNNWTHIVDGLFTPDGLYTDLLFYDQNTGTGEFYTADGVGGLNLLISYPFVHWTHIVSGFFRPNAQTMDLLFYDAPSGKAEFYSVWYGNITLMRTYDAASGDPWLTTWTQIVVGTFRDNGNTDDLLLYDPTRGVASFVSTNGHGGLAPIRDYPDWNQDWSNIVSGYFLKDMTCSSLLIYSASRDGQGLYGIGGQANENPLGGFSPFGGWTDVIPGKFLNSRLETWRNFDETSLTRVEAYASSDSVAAGETVDFCIEAEQIYRGHYFFDFEIRIDRSGVADFTFEGAGMAAPQDTPVDCSSIGCGWRASISVPMPANCKSGLYFATVSAGSMSTQVPFVVRPATQRSRILLEIAVTTMQAYNMWGGHSLYQDIPLGSDRVPVVSFDRPYSVDGDPATLAALPGFIYNRLGILSSDFIQWLEVTNGLSIDYCTSVDLHFARLNLSAYRLIISHWHDEYWSLEMRSNVESFLTQGGNVAFLGGNTCWWQIRFDASGRLLTCYKYVGEPDGQSADGTATNDPFAVSNDPDQVMRTTIYWWDHRVNWPELSLTGLTFRYGWAVARSFPPMPARGYTVARPDSWVFEGTGLAKGSIFGQESGIIGGEVDSALGPDFGNKYYWPYAGNYPYSPLNLVELAYCDLYATPGFAGVSVPVTILTLAGQSATVSVPVLPYPNWAPMQNWFLFQGSLTYKILAVVKDNPNRFTLNLSAPAVQQQNTGANVIFIPTGWASMGLFQYPGPHLPIDLNGWVFNAGTMLWTSGLDPSNLSAVSKITLNVLRKLGT
jgi:hypothetical protein